jgi:hypothetical protein
MTIPAHTPGPWRIRAALGEIEVVADHEGRHSPECLLRIKGQSNAAANAALISNAPDLLAALERLYRISSIDSEANNDAEIRDACEYAQATIRKAKAVNLNCLDGMRCPLCGQRESFYVLASHEVLVTDNGTEDEGGDWEWDDGSPARCRVCRHNAPLREFAIARSTESQQNGDPALRLEPLR